MDKRYFYPEKDGFYGAYYPCPKQSNTAFLYMLGPSADSFLVTIGVKWLHAQGCSVMALSPEPKDLGFHDLPVERFGEAVRWLKENGNEHIGIAGGSATATLALIAASYFPEITFTFAMSPCDFVMEGYYRDEKDGAKERPGDGQSTVTFDGKPLPYLPYAYRHPEYWQRLQEESKKTGNAIASREMFKRSEELHPLTEKEFIKVENIKGTLILAGAEDDCLWDTCGYIKRMKDRIGNLGGECDLKILTYRHGTHFLFPQTMLTNALPVLSYFVPVIFREGRKHLGECKKNRIDMEKKVKAEITKWMSGKV